MAVQIMVGDCRDVLRTLPADSVQMCLTSPPYFGLRDYGVAGQIGMEPSPGDYVAELVDVFHEVRRALRPDGVLFLNLGDSYASGGRKTRDPGKSKIHPAFAGDSYADGLRPDDPPGVKPKDLIGIPWMVAFALRQDGWYLRQDIIWSKPNPMPESVTDRCTKAHEYLFLLSKSERYHYDAEAIRERASDDSHGAPEPNAGGKQAALGRQRGGSLGMTPAQRAAHQQPRHGGKPRTAGNKSHKYVEAYEGSGTEEHRTKAGLMKLADVPWSSRNRRSVWTIATTPYAEAHFATMPPALAEPCILAGCQKGGTVLDPFLGAGTTGLVADRLGRDCIGIELNPAYAVMARGRLVADAGLFAEVAAQ